MQVTAFPNVGASMNPGCGDCRSGLANAMIPSFHRWREQNDRPRGYMGTIVSNACRERFMEDRTIRQLPGLTAACRDLAGQAPIAARTCTRPAPVRRAVALRIVKFLLTVFVLHCAHATYAAADGEYGDDIQQAISTWQAYDSVLAIQATLDYERLTCKSAGDALDEIQNAFHEDGGFSSVESLQRAAGRVIAAQKGKSGVLYLTVRVRISSDGQRVRNELLQPRANREMLQINDGRHNMQYRPSYHPRVPSDIGVSKPVAGPTADDIDDVIPRQLVKLVRNASTEPDAEISSSPRRWGSRIDFSVPKWSVGGVADLDSAFRIVHSRIDYKSYVQEDQFADYRKIDGIDVPWLRVTSVARRDREGRFVRGNLVVVKVGDVQVNPELSDDEFKLAAPANTRVRKLDDRGHSIERVVTSRPIDDVSAEVDGLHSSSEARTGDSAITAPLVAFLCGGALAALLAIRIYAKRKPPRD